MAKIESELYDDEIILKYPECPFADPVRVPDMHNGIPYTDFKCNHPKALCIYCGTAHYFRYMCPFDIKKELKHGY